MKDRLSDRTLADFYASLFESEARHHATYVRLAMLFDNPRRSVARLDELATAEAEIIDRGDPLARMHSWRRLSGRLCRRRSNSLSPATGISKSLAQAAAVDDQHLAGDVAARFAGQQQRGAGQLARIAPTTQSGQVGEDLFLLGRENSAGQVGQRTVPVRCSSR